MNINELEKNPSASCVTAAPTSAIEGVLKPAVPATPRPLDSEAATAAAIACQTALNKVASLIEAGAAANGVESGGSRPKTLLLVDDEENILASLKRLLRRDGYRILTANSGREGLVLLASNEVDIIISDQRMPNMTGVEFLRQAKLVWPDSIRMVLSGYTEMQSIADAINEGAIYKFLTKPWDDEQLREHVQDAFRKKGAGDEARRLQRELAAINAAQSEVNARLERLLSQQQTALDREEISLQVAHEILQHIPIPVIGVDSNEMITFANSAALGVFVEFASMLGADARDVLPPALLADGDGSDGAPVAFERAGRTFSVVRRSMGVHSVSQGRVYVLMPTGTV